MNKKLIAKVQKLTARVPDTSAEFSNAFVMEPEDVSLLERYGTLYVVYEVDGGVDIDTLLVTKLVHDVLYDTYFHSENSSPIQSLEKSILNLKDKLLGFYHEKQALDVSISIIVSVLWGNVLYIVQFGLGNSYLMREGELKTINSASEGNFSVASGVVKDNDVVILGTSAFLTKHPVESLVSSAATVSMQALPFGASALILKFTIDTTFSKDEILEIKDDSGNVPTSNTVLKADAKLSGAAYSSKLRDAVSKLNPISSAPKSQSFALPLKKVVLGLLLLAVLAFGGFFLSARFKNSSKIPPKPPVVSKKAVEGASTTALSAPKIIDTSKDIENKVTRITPELFYDIQLVDSNATPSQLILVDESLVVGDTLKGNVFVSQVAVPKFTQLDKNFKSLKQVFSYNQKLGVLDSSGMTLLDLGDLLEVQTFKEDFGEIAVYLEYLYSLNSSNGKITKYSLEGTTIEGAEWGTFTELAGAVSHAVNVSIYALDASSQLQVFTQGEKENFSISGLNPSLNGAVQVFTSEDLDNIYIADSGNNRIVVLDDSGNLIKQFQANDSSYFNNIKSIVINSTEDTLYLLDGSKIYQIAL